MILNKYTKQSDEHHPWDRVFIVGLADSAVRESQKRIESAIVNNGLDWPRTRVVVNMAPADIRKEGAAYDLPLALAILSASKQLREDGFSEYMIMGELSLDGSVQNVRGVLPMALRAKYRINPHQYP